MLTPIADHSVLSGQPEIFSFDNFFNQILLSYELTVLINKISFHYSLYALLLRRDRCVLFP